MILLVDAVAALPGLGEVGGLLTVLLASLKSSDEESVGHSYIQQQKDYKTYIHGVYFSLLTISHIHSISFKLGSPTPYPFSF